MWCSRSEQLRCGSSPVKLSATETEAAKELETNITEDTLPRPATQEPCLFMKNSYQHGTSAAGLNSKPKEHMTATVTCTAQADHLTLKPNCEAPTASNTSRAAFIRTKALSCPATTCHNEHQFMYSYPYHYSSSFSSSSSSLTSRTEQKHSWTNLDCPVHRGFVWRIRALANACKPRSCFPTHKATSS